jgi:hypothetical protein
VSENESELQLDDAQVPAVSRDDENGRELNIWRVVVMVVGILIGVGLVCSTILYFTLPKIITDFVLRCRPWKDKNDMAKYISYPWTWFRQDENGYHGIWYKWCTVVISKDDKDDKSTKLAVSESVTDEVKFIKAQKPIGLFYISYPLTNLVQNSPKPTPEDSVEFDPKKPDVKKFSRMNLLKRNFFVENWIGNIAPGVDNKGSDFLGGISNLENIWSAIVETDFNEFVFFFHGAGTPGKNYAQDYGGRQIGYKPSHEPMDPSKRQYSKPVFIYPEYFGFGDLYLDGEGCRVESTKEVLQERHVGPSVKALLACFDTFLKPVCTKWKADTRPKNKKKFVLVGYSLGTLVSLNAFLKFWVILNDRNQSDAGMLTDCFDLDIKLSGLLVSFEWMSQMTPFYQHLNSYDRSLRNVNALYMLQLIKVHWKDNLTSVTIYHSEDDEFMYVEKTHPLMSWLPRNNAHSKHRLVQINAENPLINELNIKYIDVNNEDELVHGPKQPKGFRYSHMDMNEALLNE